MVWTKHVSFFWKKNKDRLVEKFEFFFLSQWRAERTLTTVFWFGWCIMWKNKLYDHKQELQSVGISLRCWHFLSISWMLWILEQGLKSLISSDRGESANPPTPQSKMRGFLFALNDGSEVHIDSSASSEICHGSKVALQEWRTLIVSLKLQKGWYGQSLAEFCQGLRCHIEGKLGLVHPLLNWPPAFW